MAEAAELLAALPSLPDVRPIVLVPNAKGLERALAAGARAIAVFTAASETFNQKNVGRSIAASLDDFRQIVSAAQAVGAWVRGYVSTAFVCPYEGPITPERVVPVVAALREMGVDEVSIGDTLGHAVPDDIARLTEALLPLLPLAQFAYHLHDTRGTALANVERALTYGISIYDASTGGIGGCPFAPGAAGNLATERLVVRLEERGIHTGLDPRKLAIAARWIGERLCGETAKPVTGRIG